MFIVDNQQMKLVGKVTPILQQQERPIGIRSELIYSVGVRVWFYFKMIFFAQCIVLFWMEILTNILKLRFILR
jgi:hypothetical protein